MKPANTLYSALGTTIFEVMSRLADAHKAINLGQGMPDEEGPRAIVEAAAEYLRSGRNQYPPMRGLVDLREAIGEHEERYWGLTYDPMTEIIVTSGATEALASAILGLLNPGDEVIVFEPLYDCYLPLIRRGGGVGVPVRLEPPRWRLDADALKAAIGLRTKAILINDPLNPAAKVFSCEELTVLARIAVDADLTVILDGVYEHLTFGDAAFTALPSLPGMRERTVKVGSAGQIFSMTGWKVGWIVGPKALIDTLARAHQFLTFTTPPNLQAAVAYGLRHEDSWLRALPKRLEASRDRLTRGLAEAGLEVLPCQGTYFLNVSLEGTEFEGRDTEYCRSITEHRRVAAIPMSAFYDTDPERSVVRFCFAKRDEVIDEAVRRLTAREG